MEISLLRILLLVLLGIILLSLTIFICMCCVRTHRRQRRRDPHTVRLLDEEVTEYGTTPSAPELDYNETLQRARTVLQPTPFTQAGFLEEGNTEQGHGGLRDAPPTYEDLYGSVSRPFTWSLLLYDKIIISDFYFLFQIFLILFSDDILCSKYVNIHFQSFNFHCYDLLINVLWMELFWFDKTFLTLINGLLFSLSDEIHITIIIMW